MATCGYLMYGVLCEFDIGQEVNWYFADDGETYLDENWSDTQKRPYNIHGLDD
jgi:hypothetical protein